MNLSKTAKWLGIVLVAVGVLGFVPGVTADGMLLGVFMVDTVHNVIHLALGLFLLAMAGGNARMALRVVGVVFLLVLVLGMAQGGNVLGLTMVNGADHVLHLVIAVVALYFGFVKKDAMM